MSTLMDSFDASPNDMDSFHRAVLPIFPGEDPGVFHSVHESARGTRRSILFMVLIDEAEGSYVDEAHQPTANWSIDRTAWENLLAEDETHERNVLWCLTFHVLHIRPEVLPIIWSQNAFPPQTSYYAGPDDGEPTQLDLQLAQFASARAEMAIDWPDVIQLLVDESGSMTIDDVEPGVFDYRNLINNTDSLNTIVAINAFSDERWLRATRIRFNEIKDKDIF